MNVCGNCYYSSRNAIVCYLEKPCKEVSPLHTCIGHHPERGSEGRSESILRLIDAYEARQRGKEKSIFKEIVKKLEEGCGESG